MNKKIPINAHPAAGSCRCAAWSVLPALRGWRGYSRCRCSSSLSEEDQLFIIEFVKNSGSLKEMSKHLKLSYPSIRNRLDDLIAHIHKLQREQKNELAKR